MMNRLWLTRGKLIADGDRPILCCECPCCTLPENYCKMEFDLRVSAFWDDTESSMTSGGRAQWTGVIHFTPEDLETSAGKFYWSRDSAAEVEGWWENRPGTESLAKTVNAGPVTFGTSEDCKWWFLRLRRPGIDPMYNDEGNLVDLNWSYTYDSPRHTAIRCGLKQRVCLPEAAGHGLVDLCWAIGNFADGESSDFFEYWKECIQNHDSDDNRAQIDGFSVEHCGGANGYLLADGSFCCSAATEEDGSGVIRYLIYRIVDGVGREERNIICGRGWRPEGALSEEYIQGVFNEVVEVAVENVTYRE